MLNRVEFRGRDLAQSRQVQIQCLAIWRNAFDQRSKIFQVDPIRLGILSELCPHVLPRKRIDLDLVESLQCQPARQTAGPMGRCP
jgi:hypothetical protein